MIKKSLFLMIYVALITCFIFSSSTFAQRKILDENGNWNGLINVNPDPYGEPWIAGDLKPMTPEEQAEYAAAEPFVLPEELRGRSLPKTVDHTAEAPFRTIFNQQGGSCGQASGQGYHFTFERNQIWGKAGADKANQCAPGFTWNMINGGSDQGSWPSSGYSINKTNGCVHVGDWNNSEYGGTYTNYFWPDGYQAYYNGNDCHVVTTKSFTSTDVTGMKNWFYDKATGTGKEGGCVTFGAGITFGGITTIAAGPYKGQKCAASLNSGSLHAMTLAGYTEELSYDLNGDGKITNDIDITRDGAVDVRDYETGAYQLVNSWGTSFNNQGKVWVMYSGFGGGTILGITVTKVTTLLMVKAKVTSSARNGVTMLTGYATSTEATAPTATKTYGAFKKQGGAYPMVGKGQSATITVGLDANDFIANLPGGKGKVFLQITGSGTVDEMSVMDYTSGTAKEFKSTQTNVTISGTTNVGAVVELSPTFVKQNPFAVVAKTKPVTITKIGNAYTMTLPSRQSSMVTVRDMLGKILDQFSTNGKSQVTFGASLPSGMHIVSIASPEGVITEKLNIIK